MKSAGALVILLLAWAGLGGCSLRQAAAGKVGDLVAGSGAGWSADDDPQLIREALPFSLKLMESLAAESPKHTGLRLALCRGFTSYAGGFLEPEAEAIESEDLAAARALRLRAGRLHLRARDYCLTAMELLHPGSRRQLFESAEPKLDSFVAADVELLYWTGASWGSAIGLALDRPDRVAELPAVRALFERALELDPDFDRGALHEAMIVFESMPAMMGGKYERARAHFERALELAGGNRASPYVTWAVSSTVARQDRNEFNEVLGRALAIDTDRVPADRMLNLIAQARARVLLRRVDDFFFAEDTEPAPSDAE